MPPPNDLTTDTPPAPGVDATESHFDDPSVTADGPAPKPAGLPDAPPGYTAAVALELPPETAAR